MDTFQSIIAIIIAAVLMFIFPLMTEADWNDDITKLLVQTETNELVADVRGTGKLTEDEYNSFKTTLAATGNAYDIEIEVKILDENPAKKTSQTSGGVTVIGENVYYSLYGVQLEDKLAKDKVCLFKEGDIISVSVKLRSQTLAQTLRNAYYRVTGSTGNTVASSAGTITVNGK